MNRSKQARALRTNLKLRQREVEHHLELFGLRLGPYRLGRKNRVSEESHIRRLRAALEGLGPVFTCFGLYLSTRVDLLPARDCLELACLRDRAQASPSVAIENLIRRELGHPAKEIYREFESNPFISGLLDQQHHAWLHDGQAVTVTLIHPEVEEHLNSDLQLLHLLKAAFIGADHDSAQLDSAIDDFGRSFQQRADFAAQAAAIATVSKDMEVFGMLRVPFVHRELTTSKLLTIERLPGPDLNEILASSADKVITGWEAEERYGLAHRICLAWLRQALMGSLFATEPYPSKIKVLPNNQIAFIDGALASLPTEAKTSLWDYLIAVVTDNPDQASSCLLKEMEEESRPIGQAELRQRFRQLVPFRDSEWDYSGDNNNVADYLFLHWKLMNRSGYRPRVHLPSFYRGLFLIASISHRLAPHRDALRDALQNLRILAGAERVRDMLTTPRLGEQMETYFGIMMDLPQRLDEALTIGSRGNTRPQSQVPDAGEVRRNKNSAAIDVALLLVLGAIVLLAKKPETMTVPWLGRIGTVVIVLLGVRLLIPAIRHR